MRQIDLLVKCLKMIKDKKVSPDTNMEDWVRILLFAHTRGYLYTTSDASAFVIAYRIPEWKEEYGNVMPAQEGGDVLYVSMAVSESENMLVLLKMLKQYLKENKITQVVFHARNNDHDFRIYNRRNNGEEKVTGHSGTTAISA